MSFYKVGVSKNELLTETEKTLRKSNAYTDEKLSEIPQPDLSHLQTKEDAAADLLAAKAYADNKTKGLETAVGAQLKVDAHANKKDNPHSVTKAQVGLGNVEDVRQASKVEFNSHASNNDIHVTTVEKSVWNAKETPEGAQTKVDEHASNVLNPHKVTKAQVGLASVLDYGVATQTEAEEGASNTKYMTPLSTKQSVDVATKVIDANLEAHKSDKNNPHNVTKSQVGLSNVDNIKQATKVEFNNHVDNGDIHVKAAEKTTWNAKETPEGAQIKATKALTDAKLYTDAEIKKIVIPEVSDFETKGGAQARVDEHANNILNPHAVTKAQVGLSNVINEKQATETQHQQHLDDKTNPHAVTKSQVGLASVLNYGVATQAEAEAGASNAKYMTPLRTKQSVDVATKVVDNNLETHKSDTNNPHSVTKAQVGLANVDNTKQMPITGGAFTGVAKAQTNTSYTTAQLRNVIAVASGTDISKLGNNGDIIIVYE